MRSAHLAVCEEKRGFLFEKARRKMLTDGRKRTKHRETLVREKTNDEEKRKLADFVIVNDGETPLIPQVLELISLLSKNNHYLCSAKK